MNKTSTSLLLALCLALLSGCPAPSPTTGSAQLSISLPQASSAASVSRVTVTVSAAEVPSVSGELALSDGVWKGLLGNLPPGDNRTFLVQAFDASGTLLFEGSASGISIAPGQTARVSFTLQQVTPPPPPGDSQVSISINTFPRVSSLQATVSQLAVGETTSVSASASDEDGDSLSYSWTSSCAGSWAHPTSASAQFTPSALPASACNNCNLTVQVSDGRSGRASGTVALCVSAPPAPQHFAPTFLHASRFPGTTAPEQVLTFEVEASDPEGTALYFSWAANAGLLDYWDFNASTFNRVTWKAPPCVSASTPLRVTATAVNTFSLTSTQSFEVTGLPVCVSDWSATGAMAAPHAQHTATRLANGKVLIAGGYPQGNSTIPSAMAEVYDPASGTWSTTRPMLVARGGHTATLLSNGKVLVAGGSSTSSTELYDPATGTWSRTGAMATPRDGHTATLLPNGKVLVAGGVNIAPLETAEVYDPATGTWSRTGALSSYRYAHTATSLPGGKVLVAGGFYLDELATAEVYDPVAGTWSLTGSLSWPRINHTATALSDGRVLVAGGNDSQYFETAEVYDPASGNWSVTGSMSWRRLNHTATPLPDGKVLVTGGRDYRGEVATSEVYDPASGTWSVSSYMASARQKHLATLLSNGKVLVSGGSSAGNNLATAELYTP